MAALIHISDNGDPLHFSNKIEDNSCMFEWEVQRGKTPTTLILVNDQCERNTLTSPKAPLLATADAKPKLEHVVVPMLVVEALCMLRSLKTEGFMTELMSVMTNITLLKAPAARYCCRKSCQCFLKPYAYVVLLLLMQ